MNNKELQRFSISDAEAFWRRVNRLIKIKKTTQEEISTILGCHYCTLKNWSSSKIYPKLPEIYLIAQILDTSMNYLIFGVDTEPSIHAEYIIGKKVLDFVNLVKKSVNNGL